MNTQKLIQDKQDIESQIEKINREHENIKSKMIGLKESLLFTNKLNSNISHKIQLIKKELNLLGSRKKFNSNDEIIDLNKGIRISNLLLKNFIDNNDKYSKVFIKNDINGIQTILEF